MFFQRINLLAQKQQEQHLHIVLCGPITECRGASQDSQSPPHTVSHKIIFRGVSDAALEYHLPSLSSQICPMLVFELYSEQFYILLWAMLWYSINGVVFESTCKFASLRMAAQPETEHEGYSVTGECCAGCCSIAQGCLV